MHTVPHSQQERSDRLRFYLDHIAILIDGRGDVEDMEGHRDIYEEG